MHAAALLHSIQVGLPRERGVDGAANPFDQRWVSAIDKDAVAGPIVVHATHLEGDGQADRANHGGADKAICAYSAEHYRWWETALGIEPFGPGAFGENFTIAGLTEDDVCVGDTWSIGEVVCEVSQPRQPCWKLARKWRVANLTDRAITSGFTGWYFRVLRPRRVASGASLTLLSRPHPEWTIPAANVVMHGRPIDVSRSHELAAVPRLSDSWKSKLRARG